MKLKIILSFVLIYSLSILSIIAQTIHNTEANAEIVEYTNRDGLPSSNFSNIIQTNDGYLWISGIEGTYRFDGYEFEEVGEQYGLSKMQAIYYDSTKNMLYFASPEQFAIYDGSDFKYFGKEDGYRLNGLAGQTVRFVRADSKGRVWIGSETPFVNEEFNGGLTKFENGQFTVFDSLSFPLHNAIDFFETPYGDLIFTSSGKSTTTFQEAYIALYKNDKFTRVDESMGIDLKFAIFPNSDLNRIIDEDGNTWIALFGVVILGDEVNISKSGVLMYDGSTFHQYPCLENHLDNNSGISSVHYNKLDNKVYATVYKQNSESFNKTNKMVFELRNERWIKSDIIKKIGPLKNLKTGKPLIDFRYLNTSFIDNNKYFPELFGFIVSNKSFGSQSSKYSNQYLAYNENRWQKVEAFSGVPIKEIKDGLLLNTLNGFGIYYPKDYKLFTEKEGFLFPNSFIPNLYSDNNGIVWITFSRADLPAFPIFNNIGLNIWDGETLHSITEEDGLSGNAAFETFQDSKGRVWIPTSKGVTLCREIQGSNGRWIFKFEKIKSDKSNIYNSTQLLETSNGEIYAWQTSIGQTFDAYKPNFYLGKFDGEKFIEIPSPFTKEQNSKDFQFIELRESFNDNILMEVTFSDEQSSLPIDKSHIMFYDGKSWSIAPKKWNVPEEQLHFVGKLHNGMYYLTTNGFYNFDGKRFINLIDSVDANADFRLLKGASVASTKTDNQADGKLFIRLRNRGLVIFDGINLNFYTKKDGLPSANLYNPNPDSKGNMTFSHPSGALIVKDNKFQPYYDEGSELTGGANITTIDGNGNLVMHYKGLGLLIKKIDQNTYPLKISSVIIDTSNYYYNFPIDLSHTENSIIFNFAALNFKNPQETNYEYLLEGYDDEWSRPGGLSFAQYQNLPHGSYSFRVKGITSNGIKTNEASYSFVINPPFWKTWWAYSFYLILLLFVIFSIRKFEQRRMRLKEAGRIRKEKTEARIRESSLRAEAAELQAKVTETQSRAIQAENDRQTKELEEARELQLSMLPKELPKIDNLDIAVYMQTATEVGGDYYDFSTKEDRSLNIAIGDATGHGMKAGTLVSMIKSLFTANSINKGIIEFFKSTNVALKKANMERMMMGFAMLNIKGNNAELINAGLPSVYHFIKNENKIDELNIHSLPLGAMSGDNYTITKIKIDKDDVLLMMTDGFPELMNEEKELFGYDRTRELFLEMAEEAPESIIAKLKTAGSDWVKGKDPDDDVTFVVIKVK